MDEVLGSPIYMSPEIIRKEKYDQQVDVWSAGVVAYVLLSGKPPFFGQNKDDVYKAITDMPLEFPQEDFCLVSKQGVDFLKKVLEKDPKKRLTVTEVLEHPWLT